MPKLELNAKIRKICGKKVKSLRKKGILPAVVYGHKIKPQNIELEYLSFEKIYREAGESSLIDLKIDKEKPVKVIVQDVQRDPVSGRFLHIDFHQVKMSEKITTEIPLKFVNESKAVKELGGVLITNLNKIEIECLPQDLIHEIEVDLSPLNTFDDVIYIKDLKIPPHIKVLEKLEEAVATVAPPQKEEIEKEKKEEEVTEEKETEEKEEKGKEGEEAKVEVKNKEEA